MKNKKLMLYLLGTFVLLAGMLIFVVQQNKQSNNKTAQAAAPYYFGTLVTDPAHATEEVNGGVKVAMMEVFWDRYEPVEGQFSTAYSNEVKARYNALRAAGMQVTIGLGLHYPPAWVHNYANSRYINETGASSTEVNLIFNKILRQKAEAYFDKIHQDLGVQNLWAIRLTSGGDAEMLYPGGGNYWAYDVNAQNGANMPTTMLPNPYPGWKPGQTTYNGQPFTTAQVRQWAEWYIKAIDDSANWQMTKFDSLGFQGYYQMLTPGSGSRPSTYESDIANYLPVSITGVGAVWHKFYEFLPNKQRVVAYVSSMGDHSGNDDSCQPTDSSIALTSSTANAWSASRWVSRVADEYGLLKSGENVGYNAPASFNSFYIDTSATGMMAVSIKQMKDCNFQGMYWAHDDRLWDGTQSFSNYAAYIAQSNGGNNPTPPMPITPTPTSSPAGAPLSETYTVPTGNGSLRWAKSRPEAIAFRIKVLYRT